MINIKKHCSILAFWVFELMKTVDADISDHQKGASTIPFIRNLSFAKDIPFSFWSSEGWIGDSAFGAVRAGSAI